MARPKLESGPRKFSNPQGATRRLEQLSLLSLIIVLAFIGLFFHVAWIAALVLMVLLWGYMASELGSLHRSGGLVAGVVTAGIAEVRDLEDEIGPGQPGGEQRNGPGLAPDEHVVADPTATKSELYAEARDAGVEGRSKMSKDELRRALEDEGPAGERSSEN